MRSEVQIFPDPPDLRILPDRPNSHSGAMPRCDDRTTCTNLEHRFGKVVGLSIRWPGAGRHALGAIAQMGERLLCTQEVGGSIPPGSTIVVLMGGFDERVAKQFLCPCFRIRLQRKAAARDKDKDL